MLAKYPAVCRLTTFMNTPRILRMSSHLISVTLPLHIQGKVKYFCIDIYMKNFFFRISFRSISIQTPLTNGMFLRALAKNTKISSPKWVRALFAVWESSRPIQKVGGSPHAVQRHFPLYFFLSATSIGGNDDVNVTKSMELMFFLCEGTMVKIIRV